MRFVDDIYMKKIKNEKYYLFIVHFEMNTIFSFYFFSNFFFIDGFGIMNE